MTPDKRSRAAHSLAAAAAVLVVLAPALWNGFPILYPDTGGYLERPLTGTLELGRSALYGLFLLLGVPLAFWPNIVAQAALIVWLMMLTLRMHGLRSPWLALAIVAVLTLASAMPWYADTLMPDILLPAAVLSLYLLAFGQSGRLERIALIAVIAFAIASHMATLAICMGLVAALVLTRWLPLPRARLGFATSAVVAGLLLAPLSNLLIAGHFAFTPGGTTFLFGRLVQDGIVARYLADRCPDLSIRLCEFRDRMPASADDWLWMPGNPLGELGGWRAYEPEAKRIIAATLRDYPALHGAAAVRSTAEQLAMMKTEVSTTPDWIKPAVEVLGQRTPQFIPQIVAARQFSARQTVDAVLANLNAVHVGIAVLSVVALIVIVVAARRFAISPPARALAATVLLALFGNAAICGIFSNPVDRYESRLVWLAPFALIVAAASRKGGMKLS